MREPKLDIVQRMLDWADTICTLNSHVPPSSKTKMVREAAAEIERLRAELAAMREQRDEAMDERSYWYREHSRLIEKLVSLEREDNERERLDAIERNDTMTKWMDQVTAMLCHSMTHSHDAKQELVTRCDAAIAAMRKEGGGA